MESTLSDEVKRAIEKFKQYFSHCDFVNITYMGKVNGEHILLCLYKNKDSKASPIHCSIDKFPTDLDDFADDTHVEIAVNFLDLKNTVNSINEKAIEVLYGKK